MRKVLVSIISIIYFVIQFNTIEVFALEVENIEVKSDVKLEKKKQMIKKIYLTMHNGKNMK